MRYDDRPWLKSYDEWVHAEIAPSDRTYVDWLEESLVTFADRAAYHFLGVTRSFRQFDEATRRFAHFLQAAGCRKGDVVGVNLPNIPQYLIAHVGALRAGCVSTGLSPLLTPKEMEHQLNDSGAKVLVTLDAIFAGRFLSIQDKVPALSHVVAAGILDDLPSYKRILGTWLKKVPTGKICPVAGKSVQTFRDVMKTHAPSFEAVALTPEDLSLIQYTGGTTGLPKGAEITHRNIVANIKQADEWLHFERGNEIFCFAFPFFHLAGLSLGMAAVVIGATQILIPNPRDTKHICREIARYRPTGLGNVPSLYQMLLMTPEFKTLDFSTLKICGSGAAPFAVESIQALEQIVGKGKVVEVYGMTETSPFMSINPVKGRKKIGSVGLPIQGMRVKLVDLETGQSEVPIGEEGEIIARGPNVMRGYHNKPDETNNTLREFEGERWLYTGDVARMDDDGFLFIVDRAKDMLIVGGYKVFSREVEETLYQHPAIELCAIVGLPNPERPGSELVKLVVQLVSEYKEWDTDTLKAEIVAFCRENMAPYKVPKIVEFVDDLPLTAVGKVDKKALR